MLGDRTRLRLLALLEHEELTVAELAAITHLAQPRVSTHLARLREAGLVLDRRDGVNVFYRPAENQGDATLAQLWLLIREHLDDGLLSADLQRLPEVLEARREGQNWPDSVAGDMERHYSPGRTWESTTRAFAQLLELGRVLDIASGDGVTADLLAGQAKRIDCIDLSEKVVDAGRRRLADHAHVHFHQGDMHALPFDEARFDTVFLLHALTYSERPEKAIAEAARVLDHGGVLSGATLKHHRHNKHVRAYGHVNNGFNTQDIERWCGAAGLKVVQCGVSSVERRPPHFQIITFLARRA